VGVHFEVRGMLPSRGTVRSGLGLLGKQRVVLTRTRVRFIGEERDAIEWAGGERLTIPRHVPGARFGLPCWCRGCSFRDLSLLHQSSNNGISRKTIPLAS
jgi:hypothetical protein